jgi:hypothetical protein
MEGSSMSLCFRRSILVLRQPILLLRRSILAILPMLSILAPLVSFGQDEEIEADAAAVAEERGPSLEAWAHEPVELQTTGGRLRVDRRDGSFFLHDFQSQQVFFSPAHRRGFASVVFANGQHRRVDRIEDVRASGEFVRFRAASSQGALPPNDFEIRSERGGFAISYRFESTPIDAGAIIEVRLLDGAPWVSDDDGGGVAAPIGLGRWFDAKSEDAIDITLDGPETRTDDDPSDVGTRWSAPVFALTRGPGTIVVIWENSAARLEIRRSPAPAVNAQGVAATEFPGNSGLFVSLVIPALEGRLELASGSIPHVGTLDFARVHRERRPELYADSSLRSKGSVRVSLESIHAAPVMRISAASGASGLVSPVRAHVRFADIAAFSERLRSVLDIREALFLIDDWLGSEPDADRLVLAPARECGGADGLADASAGIHRAGHILGLAIGRENAIADVDAERPRGAAAWSRASEDLRSSGALEILQSSSAPDLILVRDGRDEPLDVATVAARSAFVSQSREHVPIWASSSFDTRDLTSFAFVETSALVPEGTDRRRFLPMLVALYGLTTRWIAAPGSALEPGDAEGLLVALLLAQNPTIAVPPEALRVTADTDGTSRDVAAGSGDNWCFAKAEGWSRGKGLSAREVFIKNAAEICADPARFHTREPLVAYRVLSADGSVIETQFGYDLRILVNFGDAPYEDEQGSFVLPKYGFVVRYPFFFAFHASVADGMVYSTPAFFTVRSLEGKLYLRAEKTRIYHGFGPNEIRLGGREFTVDTEAEVKIQ